MPPVIVTLRLAGEPLQIVVAPVPLSKTDAVGVGFTFTVWVLPDTVAGQLLASTTVAVYDVIVVGEIAFVTGVALVAFPPPLSNVNV